jgi:hypothetical protein
MAGRHKQFENDASPGPKYMIEKGWTNKGADGSPKVGMSSKHKDLAMFNTPSPEKYSIDQAGNQVFKTAPSYSMSSRTKTTKSDNTPAPNSYSLPPTLGEKLVDKEARPAYSLRSRPAQGGFAEDLQRTPGPGAYKITEPSVYKQRSAAYTMTARNELPGDSTTKPGPGAHKPENVTVNRKAAPGYTFGSLHSAYMAPMIDAVQDD